MSNDKQQLTLLVPAAARSAHTELLAALGTENSPGHWMIFMDAVTKLLPDVLSSGRPTAEAIRRCAIGQLGFASWQAMIEAPVEAGGLDWNVSAWKAWRRAWSAVEAHQWLRGEQLTSSEINTIANESRRENMDFPSSKEEIDTFQKARKDAQEKRKSESVAELTKKADDAQAAAQAATATLEEVRQQLAAGLIKIEQQAEYLGKVKSDLVAAETSREQWKEKAQKAPKAPAPMTRWQHLSAFLTGSTI
jgi:hypothetical protein